jgi:hypothetical protein
MIVLIHLTPKYTELWKEYLEFLKLNNLSNADITKICFIYSDKYHNEGCLDCEPELLYDELCMYNYSVDDDCNKILVDNEYGAIYVKMSSGEICAFRCTNYPLKPKTFRLLNMWNMKQFPSKHLLILKDYNF